MDMRWQIDNSRPVYIQIMEHIRNAVLTEEFPPGCRIPSVRDLAGAANVNPNTMQRALTELEEDGLLISNGTLGRFVTKDDAIIGAIRQNAVRKTVRACAAQFRAIGLSMEEAAHLLLEEKEEG
jgi:DNA-binding transcriptional regulator YhcF (GntR family)